MASIEFEIVGEAFDKHTDDHVYTVYRVMGGGALYLCDSDLPELPEDVDLESRDRTGSGFSRHMGSEPPFEKGGYQHTASLGIYNVLGLALKTDSRSGNDWWVVYEAMNTKGLYARPFDVFAQKFRKINTAQY